MTIRLPQPDSDGFERIVFGEVLIPDEPNVFGDFHTRQSVREFAYGFMLNGFGINHEHDTPDISDEVSIIESFIARDGDPTFIIGSWVLGVFVGKDEVWQAILDGAPKRLLVKISHRKYPTESDSGDEKTGIDVGVRLIEDATPENMEKFGVTVFENAGDVAAESEATAF